MDKEPVYVELARLRAELHVVKMDRDHAWQALIRLRKAYSMIRYHALTEKTRLFYEHADAVAAGLKE